MGRGGWRRWPQWGVLALAAALLVTLTNCAVGDRPVTTSEGGPVTSADVLVYGSAGQPVNLEPGNVTDGNSLIVQDQIYNRLLEFKPGTTELQPGLATKWDVSPDGKTWTFTLREGVKFHDGTPFDAEAVKFNVERWWDPNFAYGFRTEGKIYEIWQQLFGGYKGDPKSLLQAINAPNDRTVEFVLSQPFSAFPNVIGSSYFGIASPTAIQKAGADYGKPEVPAVGTGPFVFQAWRTGDRITLAANPDYWKPDLPAMANLVFRFVESPAARLAQLRAGQLDFTIDLAPDQKAEVEADANLTVVARPSFNVGYLALNPSYEPLADVRVRQAIAQAINSTAIVQSFWGDLAVHDAHFTPPALAWAQSSQLQPYAYDPNQAKNLLAQAGYPNGFDLDLWYMPVSRPYYPTPKPIAEAFAADLSAIGIRVNLKTQDWAAYLEDRRKPPGYQSFMLGWTADYGDPDSFYYPHFGPGGTDDIGNWENPRVIELLNQGRAASDQTTRAKIYSEVDEILHQAALRLPIVHSQPLLAKRQTVQGWTPSPLGSEPFETVQKGE